MSGRKVKDSQKTEELFASVLSLISEGKSVREACRVSGVHEATFRKSVDQTQYARAREACADTHFDELGMIAERVLLKPEDKGYLDPQAARVAADIVKWRVARMRPKVYGDKIPTENEPTDQKTGIITALKEIFNADRSPKVG